MPEIITLNFQDQEVRSFSKEDGSIWFIASDCCKILGLGNVTEALRRLHDSEKSSFRISEQTSKGGNPNKILISESGLYKLIMRSTKTSALKFQDWVTQDVLPTIRKDGGYINPADYRDPYKIMENMMVQARIMNETIKAQAVKINELAPKARMLDDLFKPLETDISFNTAAKVFKFITIGEGKGVGGIMLKDKCIEDGLISKKDRLPKQDYVNKGYFKVFYGTASNGLSYPATRITKKGQVWLYNRMLKYFNKAAQPEFL